MIDMVALHEFCRNPLHPGPCKGWKGTKAAATTGPAAAVKAPAKPKAAPAVKAVPVPAKPAAAGKPKVAEVMTSGRKVTPEHTAAAEKIYGGTFGGITVANITVKEAGRKHFQVEGDLLDADGRKVGKFNRGLHVDPEDGKLYAVHGDLEIDPNLQGQGFAQAFNANLIDWYRANGVDRVNLYANLDVGGYAWARAGYDWAEEEGPATIRKLLHQGVAGNPDLQKKPHRSSDQPYRAARFRSIPAERLDEQRKLAQQMIERMESLEFGDPDYPTPYEVSQLGRWEGAGKDDWWAGKAVMMGSGWEAVRPL
jgi:GNAT superfamily N-acetyltransferase